MCKMMKTFAGTLATWASEQNGSTPTHDVLSVFITSVSHDTNCTAILQLWFQHFCSDRHEITAKRQIIEGEG